MEHKIIVHSRICGSLEIIAAVWKSVAESPGISVWQLSISKSTMQRILVKHACKVQLLQNNKPRDHAQRRRFADWVWLLIWIFRRNIFFWIRRIFNLRKNKQNCRIWVARNSRVILHQLMHPPRITVWCTLWAAIGAYFFKNAMLCDITKC